MDFRPTVYSARLACAMPYVTVHELSNSQINLNLVQGEAASGHMLGYRGSAKMLYRFLNACSQLSVLFFLWNGKN